MFPDSNKAGPSARHHGASHKGERMNRWNEDNMRQAILEFNRHKNKTDGTGLPVRQIARAWCVPYSTFRKRIMKQAAEQTHSHSSGRPTVLVKMETFQTGQNTTAADADTLSLVSDVYRDV